MDGEGLAPQDVFIGISFSQEMRALIDENMRAYHVTWADFLKVEIPEWATYPYMVRIVFRPRPNPAPTMELTREGSTFVVEETATGRIFWHPKEDE